MSEMTRMSRQPVTQFKPMGMQLLSGQIIHEIGKGAESRNLVQQKANTMPHSPYSSLELSKMETEWETQDKTMSSATRANELLEALRSRNLSAVKLTAALPSLERLADIRQKGSVYQNDVQRDLEDLNELMAKAQRKLDLMIV